MSRQRAAGASEPPHFDEYRHNLADPANPIYLATYADLPNPNVHMTGSHAFQGTSDWRFHRLKPSNLAQIRGFGVRDVNEVNIVQLREAQQTMFLQQFRMFPDVSSSASADQYVKADVDANRAEGLQATLATILSKANSALIGDVAPRQPPVSTQADASLRVNAYSQQQSSQQPQSQEQSQSNAQQTQQTPSLRR